MLHGLPFATISIRLQVVSYEANIKLRPVSRSNEAR